MIRLQGLFSSVFRVLGFEKTRLMNRKSCIALMTLNYEIYGIFLIMGDAGFVSST